MNQRELTLSAATVPWPGIIQSPPGVSVSRKRLSESRKGLARHLIPVILPARLAVDKDEKGTGLGKAVLKDALLRIAQAADIVGACGPGSRD
jgi:hypothetical protein